MDFAQRIITTLEEIAKTKVPGYRQKIDRELGLIFIYQTICKWATKKLTDTLKEYLKDNNISDSYTDYDSRKYVVASGNRFILLFTVSNPRKTFSKDTLKLLLMREYNISADKCQDLIDRSHIEGVKNITKSVILKD